jgi:FlaA1/EpsC-like NDP-sugar epimerase
VTVTDPSMCRYFMSIHEAVQLVLQAAALSEGGEVSTLRMGEPVNIMELARKVITLSGLTPGRDVDIEIVGARPGEKLAEELIDPEEEPVPSANAAIVVSRPAVPDRAVLRRALRDLERSAREGRDRELSVRFHSLANGSLRPDPVEVGA